MRLAQAGLSVLVLEANETIGGGTRSAQLTLPGFVHDVCSAVHPLGVGSPFFHKLELEHFGLEWLHPEIPLAHPLDGSQAAGLERSVDLTAETLGRDGRAYRRLFSPLVANWDKLAAEFLQPLIHLPRHPIQLARFGWRAFRSAAGLADVPVEELELSVRALNCLKANDITRIGQLLGKREDELLSLRNFGKKSLDEIKEKLVERGFVPAEEIDNTFS